MRTIVLSLLLFFMTEIGFAGPINQCLNNRAHIILNSTNVNDLMSLITFISSMPLSGKLLADNGDMAEIEISTPKDYADANGFNSFDVAKKVIDLLKERISEWGIQSVKASVCFDDNSPAMSNVGTIGH